MDLEDCAKIATYWYKRSPEWCFYLLREWHDWGIITDLGVRADGNLIAACMAVANVIRSSTAAIYCIYAPDEDSLEPMLAKAVNCCVDYGTHNLIADLINDNLAYEPVYQALGFKKVAEWARLKRFLDENVPK